MIGDVCVVTRFEFSIIRMQHSNIYLHEVRLSLIKTQLCPRHTIQQKRKSKDIEIHS